ncbi:hypothetical protein [Microcella alkalica]|uniref:DUF4190 domain-containing protein n=1 Tax=Microcella alkalica TaxID=355930 RepID=A0A839E8R4_9MICO|nr:hypothetical protein [Microcella alkalica]MBA8847583.1 hypothetical protein [Microcella alkalica]
MPALGAHAPEPIARPSILGLLGMPSPTSVADDEPTAAPPAPVHPLGVPIISARRAPGPGANPTHIGRASSYITAPPAVAAAPASTSPPAGPPAHSAPPAHTAPVSHSATSAPAASPEALSRTAPSEPSLPPLDRQSVGRSSGRRYSPPPVRSTAATWALVTGLLPLLVSLFGNTVTTHLGTEAIEATASGVTSGAWAPVFVALSLVFVSNAALLTVCAITGVRGIRETANGVTRGRPLAVSGLAAGAVNLVLLVAGLVISISGLSTVLA